MISDLIFDFFGTLVSYAPGQLSGAPYAATHQLLRDHDLAISYDDFAATFTRIFRAHEEIAQQSHIEYPMAAVFRAFLRERFTLEAPEAFVTTLVKTYVGEWNRGTHPLPEIQPFLTELARRYRLSILSNTHYATVVHANLAAMGVRDLMAQVITSDIVGVRKPNPRIFAHALAGLGIAPEQALFIGDTYHDDYLGARDAGLRALLIDPHHAHPELGPARIDQLFALTTRLG